MVELKKLETPLQQLPPINQTPFRILTIVQPPSIFFFKNKKNYIPLQFKNGEGTENET